MKKTKITPWVNWFKEALFKALVILLVVIGGTYTYAQIVWPASDPNPTTGLVGVFVGESNTSFDQVLDYVKANQLCENSSDPVVQGSHICTPAEMSNSYNHGIPGVSSIFTYTGSPTLWINSGPPGFTANSNDCKGWTAVNSPLSNPNYGTVWNFKNQFGSLLPCDTGKKFACCK